MELLIILNHNNFQLSMITYSNCFPGFIPTDLQQYFIMVPNYFSQPLVYYPCRAALETQISHQVLPSPTLDQHFTPSPLPKESQKDRQEHPRLEKAEKSAKIKKNLNQKEEEQSFNIKISKSGPFVTYKKKNTESNIVNQTFSYLSSDRSKQLVSKVLQDSNKVEEYYRIVTKIKQLNKKYINRNYLLRLLAFEASSEFQKAFLKAKPVLLCMEDVRSLIRVLIFYFLRAQVNLTLMTSGKIYKETLPQHFWRKREIIDFLFAHCKL